MNDERWYLGVRVTSGIKLEFARLGGPYNNKESAKLQYSGSIADAHDPACVAVISALGYTFDVREVLCDGEWQVYNPYILGRVVRLRDYEHGEIGVKIFDNDELNDG